jgi:hypothetical protein
MGYPNLQPTQENPFRIAHTLVDEKQFNFKGREANLAREGCKR